MFMYRNLVSHMTCDNQLAFYLNKWNIDKFLCIILSGGINISLSLFHRRRQHYENCLTVGKAHNAVLLQAFCYN